MRIRAVITSRVRRRDRFHLQPPIPPRAGGDRPIAKSVREVGKMKRLYRSRTQRILGGVCGGLGDFLGIDPTLIRLAWAFLSLTGAGLLFYFVAWLIIPEEPAR
jgi:phage shock protein PspC (stress-responsive transcriptional regulator)